ncbi:MAG: DUF3783 domain-containing protein [Oscillospiraceae bacterium]
MKSRIVNKSPKMILSYGITGDKFNSLIEVTKSSGIVLRQVFPSELDIKVSQLLRVSQLNLEEYPLNCDECILIANFDNSSIDRLLSTLRSRGINVPIKATLTPTNQTWTFRYLLKELKSEHEELSKNN